MAKQFNLTGSAKPELFDIFVAKPPGLSGSNCLPF
jgi:hypothetical protein